MIEDVFEDGIPTLYVFPYYRVARLYKGAKPISSGDWWSRFFPYYPSLNETSPDTVSKEDTAFAKTFLTYLAQRSGYLKKINRLFEGNVPLPEIRVTGVKQLRLAIQKPSETFEGCQSLFYATKTNHLMPYMRIIPSDGTPISKVLVSGALPIPDMDNPEVIGQWAKEPTPTMGHDFLMLKYVHRESIGIVCPIYGTIRIFHDGTADILVQPPKNVRRLEPDTDFNGFGRRLQEVCKDLRLDLSRIEVGEAALVFQLDADRSSIKFTKAILKKRLGFFSPFFQEIAPLKDQQTLISFRYKAVSQYASENSIFSFITQYAESKKLAGAELPADIIGKIQDAFQISGLDARSYIAQWFEQKGTLSTVVPEENEFMESFNPGIDIHIYGPHPSYTIHVHRVDSYQTFQRLYSLLRVLFLEEDSGVFTDSEAAAASYSALESRVETTLLKEEAGDLEEDEDAKSTASGVSAAANDDITFDTFRRAEEEEEEPEVEAVEAEEDADETIAPVTKSKKRREDNDIINPFNWFLDELKRKDNDLFVFKPTRKGGLYSRKCGAVEDRQPVALTEKEFNDMIEEYDKEISDGSLFFNIYPLKKGEKEKAAGAKGIRHDATEITVSKYGSSLKRLRYYFCPALFCLKDQKMVLESDFDSDEDREGNPKDRFTCPFCYGTEIIEHDKGGKGQTVFRRMTKKDSDKAHLYIGFVKNSTRSDKLGLPCCHLKKKTMKVMKEDLDQLYSEKLLSDRGTYLPAEIVDEEDAAEEEELKEIQTQKEIKRRLADVKDDTSKATISFAKEFAKISDAYIVDEKKHPLDPGKFGILPAPFDEYFQQTSSTFVKRTTSQQKLLEKSRGFLRVGTEIGPLTAKCDTAARPIESLFGVLAPLLYKNSIQDVRELFLKAVTGPSGVLTFVNANFGNLVSEFYVPSDPDLGTKKDLGNITDQSRTSIVATYKLWADDNLHVGVNDTNVFAIRRIYKAYTRFEAFLKDKTKRKDVRHFSSFLTEAGLLTSNRRGLQLIILEWSPGQEKVIVKCSPYGFSREHQEKNDFAFVWRDSNGFYELLFYTENTKTESTTVARWKYDDRSVWPRIVKDRINEYMGQCQSEYKSIFTSQMDINSNTLVPLSKALTTVITVQYKGADREVLPYGIVRDSYNHAIFVLYPQRPKGVGPESSMIAMPIVDDGYMPKGQQLFLDIEDFYPAPADQIIEYYATYLTAAFSSYPGYAVHNVVRKKEGSKSVKGLQLENNIYIPAANAEGPIDRAAYPDTTRKVNEWDMNRDLSQPCGSADIKNNTQAKIEELYQYFRFMVSNWIATDAGSEVRDTIKTIVFDDGLPEFEKRKRLEILCGNFRRGEDEESGWLGWMQPTEEDWDMPSGILRKDCRVIKTEDKCSAPCVWNSEGGEGGQCLLHVKTDTDIRSVGEPTAVNTRILFSRRVIDELIRFPKKRKELIKHQVSTMSAIVEPIRDGDQYIIPERGMDWLALLRLDWRPADKEMPLYHEEMYQRAEGEPVATGSATDLPEELEEIVGSTTPYQLWMGPGGLQGLGPILKVNLQELGVSATDTKLSESAIQEYVKKTGIPMGIIDTTQSDIMTEFVRGPDSANAVVIVYIGAGVGLLIDTPKRPTISIDGLDGELLDAWNSATKVATTAVKSATLRRAVKTTITKEVPKGILKAPTTNATAKPKALRRIQFALPSASVETPVKPAAPPMSRLVRKSATVPVELPETTVKTVQAPSRGLVRKSATVPKTQEELPETIAPVIEKQEESTVKTVQTIVPSRGLVRKSATVVKQAEPEATPIETVAPPEATPLETAVLPEATPIETVAAPEATPLEISESIVKTVQTTTPSRGLVRKSAPVVIKEQPPAPVEVAPVEVPKEQVAPVEVAPIEVASVEVPKEQVAPVVKSASLVRKSIQPASLPGPAPISASVPKPIPRPPPEPLSESPEIVISESDSPVIKKTASKSKVAPPPLPTSVGSVKSIKSVKSVKAPSNSQRKAASQLIGLEGFD